MEYIWYDPVNDEILIENKAVIMVVFAFGQAWSCYYLGEL